MAAIHHFAPARRSPSVFASAVAALANCVRMVSRALKNRRDATMLAGMAAAGSQTVFVKLMGPGPLLAAEKENFVKLCESLGVQE